MDINVLINEIVRLPHTFYESGNTLSMHDLLKKINYVEVQDEISDIDFQRALIEHPEYIDSWLAWSENKRSDAGWFFEISPYGQYTVGCFDSKLGRMNERNYSNSSSACAFFISKEIDSILRG